MIAITGTPGVGKTTVARVLRERGFSVIDLNRVLKSESLLKEYDDEARSFLVDVDELKGLISENSETFVEGHLSHYTDCDIAFVLRCHPRILRERLKRRGYDDRKIAENYEAEALDVVLVEATMRGLKTYEIDVTDRTADSVADVMIGLIRGTVTDFEPGSVDWSGVVDEWV